MSSKTKTKTETKKFNKNEIKTKTKKIFKTRITLVTMCCYFRGVVAAGYGKMFKSLSSSKY